MKRISGWDNVDGRYVQRPRISKNCRQCGGAFWIPPSREWREHYCSTECRTAYNAATASQLIKTCEACGKAFKGRRSVEIKTCSMKCAGVMTSRRRHTPESIAKRLASWERNGNREKASQRRGPKSWKFTGRKIQTGYVMIWVEGRGYVQEHRYVMEQQMGRLLSADEIVHHKNRDKQDNRVENLEVMTKREHAMEHFADVQAACPLVIKGHKLDIGDVAEIKEKLKAGVKIKDIAAQHNVSSMNVYDIKNGHIWRHVE